MTMVEISNLDKSYTSGGEENKVLTGLEFQADAGEMVMIMGPSGCGKTTLLNLMGGIDAANGGTIVVAGQELTKMSKKELNRFRREKVGFIFQFYNLIPTLTAAENVELGLEALVKDKKEMRKRSKKYLELVGLGKMLNRFPQELSGGEQQRVAIARALAKEPKMVLADEPTGNLDEDRGEKVMELMKQLKDEFKITFFIVSHNQGLKKHMDRTLSLRRGVLQKMES